ncbi:hypothetical protein PHJA_000659000 [Phtheirospermum japonicum]|uniref:Selenoprotein H n=1 Tax=Phtheirospermum japonicum TaxID=374723 RepID=A0A830BG32_9LAMI|nr:hypothetical protein PHJA_000659000 [Phtheirospermum japonicum]
MAPKRKLTTATTRSAARNDARATRSAIRRGEAILNTPFEDPEPRKRRKVEAAAPSSAPAASAPAAAASSSAAAVSTSAAGASSSAAVKTVIIEHCLQNDSFKKKADQVRKGLEKAVSGVNVMVNPEAPRKGCFEIREDGGDAFVSLLDIESPFDAVKAVDVKKVVADIVGKIK